MRASLVSSGLHFHDLRHPALIYQHANRKRWHEIMEAPSRRIDEWYGAAI